ncbi:choloylglycine hydrolase family protein [Oenococcus sicerae]|uniref:Choloylglycine hydrolase family protein n=1 Tax=Oenococcus sicerae TaxID=2203724 RepID=A0AAJ1R9K3_9LACO|nr:choloylglycine hydrolase family protein [Oenococcus sicerae]MDN6900272.1 choloylglycine hydrolase family protein [Oenococcus sicerae]QAS69849.1 choloylglycine hydrolase family protein [Oenococcus sicerae]
MIGCSSFVLNSEDGTHLLSRTMDFTIEMAENVIYTPRGKEIDPAYQAKQKYQSRLAFVGMGQLSADGPLLFDGVNEAGLTAATLYFPQYAEYTKKSIANQIDVSPDKIVTYVLANFKNLAEVKKAFESNIQIVAQANPVLGITPPLHWIFMDQSGRSLIVEPTKTGLKTYADSLGVMTNSPDYSWQETNLRNYLPVQPKQHSSISWSGKHLTAFSQGSGTFGLPGDFTPTSRFVRVAFLKSFIQQPKDELETVTAAANILKSVSIPKGIVLTETGGSDYTCYSSYMSSQTKSYYFATYSNQRMRKVSLTQTLLANDNYVSFPVTNDEDVQELNK